MKYGRIAVDNKEPFLDHAHTRVLIDGEDITRHCFEADDIAGYALVYCVPYRKTGAGTDASPLTLESEVLTGNVEILLGPRESARRIRAAHAEACSPPQSV